MRAHIVIGANYGDEGKGLITDYLVDGLRTKWVVRFNGGAQAGHTVQRNGVRHVFRHFGSGTLAGANTYLARQFVCNPAIFAEEYAELARAGVKMPIVAVDPDCIVTTPLDMLINQALEKSRTRRHGSCGVGFGQTIERHQHPYAQLRVSDLGYPEIVQARLRYIIDGYGARFIEAHEMGSALLDQARMMSARFIEDCTFFWDRTLQCAIEEPLHDGYQHVVFEGAQGLLLSQSNHNDFPHVTRSYTGTRNTVPLLHALNIRAASVYYVSRSYLTRHGAGPFPSEDASLAGRVTDETNKPNEYQGTMRFAPLDFDQLKNRVGKDLEDITPYLEQVTGIVAATCLDEVPNRLMEVSCPIQSYGPTAESVRWLEDCIDYCSFHQRPKTVESVTV